MWIPTDSTDAREQRELEHAQAEAAREEVLRHSEECTGGWLGEDLEGRPRPCPQCRPYLQRVDCRTCGVGHEACVHQLQLRRGPCCDRCCHSPKPPPRAGGRPPTGRTEASA